MKRMTQSSMKTDTAEVINVRPPVDSCTIVLKTVSGIRCHGPVCRTKDFHPKVF
jgi:hypothetical protein